MLQKLVQPSVLNPLYTMTKTFKNIDSEVLIMFLTLMILVSIFAFIYIGLGDIINREIKEIQEQEEQRKCFKEMSKASVTDNGVPANEVFKTLEENGIHPNYLGGKDI